MRTENINRLNSYLSYKPVESPRNSSLKKHSPGVKIGKPEDSGAALAISMKIWQTSLFPSPLRKIGGYKKPDPNFDPFAAAAKASAAIVNDPRTANLAQANMQLDVTVCL